MLKNKLLFFESIMVIVGSVVGAGVLGIPYVVAQVGFVWGMFLIIALGLVVLMLHLMLGDVVSRTRQQFQLGGLARQHLGSAAGVLMNAMLVFMGTAALVAYSIGMGESAYALFAGSISLTAFQWGLIFAGVASLVVMVGIRGVARMEMIFASLVFMVVVILIGVSMPQLTVVNLTYVAWPQLLVPYGVLLFAFHGATSIATSEEVSPHHPKKLHRAIIIAGLVPIVLYALFTFAVVGVTGAETTPIATIGLGTYVGPMAVIFGNVFALFAMLTSFFGVGFALRRIYEWDMHVPPRSALVCTLLVPLLLYAAGVRNFISTIGVAGAVCGSIEALLIVAIYLRARRMKNTEARSYGLHMGAWIIAGVVAVFLIGGVHALYQLLRV